MADTPSGETAKPGDTQTTVQTPVTPAPVQSNAGDPAEVERLRKELEKQELRNRQLENERTAREKADEETRSKKLEEDNQFKELFEQEKAKREALESEQQKQERDAELMKAKQEALSGFSDEVKSLAEEVGLNLTDAEESSVEEFKGKLTKLSEKVSSETKVTPNNPNQPASKSELTPDQLREGLSDEHTFHDIVTKQYPGIAAMTNQPKVAK